MLSFMLPFDAVTMALHAIEKGDNFLLKLILYQHDLDTIFAFAMQPDMRDETPTDIVKQFVRFKLLMQVSGPRGGTDKNSVVGGPMPFAFLKSALGKSSMESKNEPVKEVDVHKADYAVEQVLIDHLKSNLNESK